MSVRYQNKSTVPSQGGVLELIKTYWFVILGLFLAIPFLIRYLRDANTDITINNQQEDEKLIKVQNQNPTTQKQGLDKITTREDLQLIARNVAYNFGTSIQTKDAGWTAFLNPRGWTENDEKAYNQLKKINYATSRDLVAKCYYFLTRRNLYDDVKTLLDEEYQKKLPLFK